MDVRILFHLISWEQIDEFWWNLVYAVLWRAHEIFLNFSAELLPLTDVKISIFRNNEWILITFCLCIDIYDPILREEVEVAVKVLKMRKPAGVDNIPAELVQAGGEAMTDILTDILTAVCNKIWKTEEWPTTWTQSLVITLPKKGNLQLCQIHEPYQPS